MSIEQLKKILESERVINCHNYREHLKRVGTIIESGMSSWAKTANGYRDGSKDMENRLLPLLQKAVEMVKFVDLNTSFCPDHRQNQNIPFCSYSECDIKIKAREFLAEIKKESGE